MEMVALPPPSDMNGENSDQDYFQEASNDPEYSDNPQQDAPSRDHQPDAPTGNPRAPTRITVQECYRITTFHFNN